MKVRISRQSPPRALRVPGMKWLDTGELAEDVKQLKSLLQHCREMAEEADSAKEWARDAEALGRVIKALEGGPECRGSKEAGSCGRSWEKHIVSRFGRVE